MDYNARKLPNEKPYQRLNPPAIQPGYTPARPDYLARKLPNEKPYQRMDSPAMRPSFTPGHSEPSGPLPPDPSWTGNQVHPYERRHTASTYYQPRPIQDLPEPSTPHFPPPHKPEPPPADEEASWLEMMDDQRASLERFDLGFRLGKILDSQEPHHTALKQVCWGIVDKFTGRIPDRVIDVDQDFINGLGTSKDYATKEGFVAIQVLLASGRQGIEQLVRDTLSKPARTVAPWEVYGRGRTP